MDRHFAHSTKGFAHLDVLWFLAVIASVVGLLALASYASRPIHAQVKPNRYVINTTSSASATFRTVESVAPITGSGIGYCGSTICNRTAIPLYTGSAGVPGFDAGVVTTTTGMTVCNDLTVCDYYKCRTVDLDSRSYGFRTAPLDGGPITVQIEAVGGCQ